MLFVQRLRGWLASIAEEDGQAMVEYALLVSLVAIATAVAVQAFGAGVANLYSNIQAQYP
jgi:Flp pilus assembly pilin Flp